MQGKQGRVSINLHRQPHITVTHQFHCFPQRHTGKVQICAELVPERMKVHNLTGDSVASFTMGSVNFEVIGRKVATVLETRLRIVQLRCIVL